MAFNNLKALTYNILKTFGDDYQRYGNSGAGITVQLLKGIMVYEVELRQGIKKGYGGDH
ncbi:288_t:CDS:2 [Funneliformis geosporum]|nr:288_t:CDS:2 [Funneliformis geosporum]